jgi:dihydroorotate dehydrogenase
MAGLLGAGFGFVEVGSITPRPQPGNPRPRMFRLSEDRAVINRFGFNSDGLVAVLHRIGAYWGTVHPRVAGDVVMAPAQQVTAPEGSPVVPRGVVGINVGKNKDGAAEVDYGMGVALSAPFADYLVVNVSSPNTPGLRSLQTRTALTAVINAAKAARDALPWGAPLASKTPPLTPAMATLGVKPTDPLMGAWHLTISVRPRPPPLFVKIAPDLTPSELADVVQVSGGGGGEGGGGCIAVVRGMAGVPVGDVLRLRGCGMIGRRRLALVWMWSERAALTRSCPRQPTASGRH